MKAAVSINSRRFLLCQRWLLALDAIIVIFGAALAFLYPTPLFDIFRTQIDPVFWAARKLTGSTVPFQQWSYGVLAVMMPLLLSRKYFLTRNP